MKRAPLKPGRGMAASPAQRAKVSDRACIVCQSTPVDAAHLVPRALDNAGHPDAVVALCRQCHVDHHAGTLDLLPYWRRMPGELAFAVARVGPSELIHRLTGRPWASVGRRAA